MRKFSAVELLDLLGDDQEPDLSNFLGECTENSIYVLVYKPLKKEEKDVGATL